MTTFGSAAGAQARPATFTQARHATFTLINSPNGPGFANFALAADGNTMAADFNGRIYRWTGTSGFTDLGAGDPNSAAIAISSGGDYVVATRRAAGRGFGPARWSQTTGWLGLGHIADGCPLSGEWGSGYGVSHDGSRVVGLAWDCSVRAEAFLWSPQTQMISLGHPNGVSSRASAISADGSTIVGFSEDPQQGFRRAILWRNGGRDLIAGVHTPGEAAAVSSDGSQIAGQSSPASWPSGSAFYFTKELGVVSLGTLSHNSFDQSFANGVSDNGTVVGWSGNPFSGGTQAFIWNAKAAHPEMVSLRTRLIRNGATIPANVYLTTAVAISADSSTVVGTWQDNNFNQGSFIARLK